MQSNLIYHNPRCSKSRKTLELIMDQGISIEVRDYRQEAPAIAELRFICEKLEISPKALIRNTDKKFIQLNVANFEALSEESCYRLIHENPEILQRPIVVYNGRVAIGRPPENVLTIL